MVGIGNVDKFTQILLKVWIFCAIEKKQFEIKVKYDHTFFDIF